MRVGQQAAGTGQAAQGTIRLGEEQDYGGGQVSDRGMGSGLNAQWPWGPGVLARGAERRSDKVRWLHPDKVQQRGLFG